jgi:hypothetical protein
LTTDASGYERPEYFRLGSTSGWGEDFVQNLVKEDPSLLGLGDLVVKDKERHQIGAGRLDFLLQDSPVTVRYEVEIQLGETNPSHIIRTIEYWERERRNAPQFEHVAVLVAEVITERFFNVISLFNQHIPLVAIKMTGVSVGGKRTIIFTKVLDHTKKNNFEDEDAGIPETDRSYWEGKTSQATMALVDGVVSIAKKIDPAIGPRFNKGSIPLKKGTEFWRFLTLRPKKKFLKMSLPCPQSEQLEAELNAADIDFDDYDERRGRYVLTLVPGDLPKHADLLQKVIAAAYKKTGDEAGEAADDE